MSQRKFARRWMDNWRVVFVCPFHGTQDGMDYEAGQAPCGCTWVAGDDDLLYAHSKDGARCAPVIIAVSAVVPDVAW
jgi:hypothetical protein